MESRLIEYFFLSYWEFLIPADLLLIIGVTCFTKLPKEKKGDIRYWLPLLIVFSTVFHENMGAYTNYNFEFKKSVNAYLGNTEYPHFNLWLFNIARRQIGAVLYLILIRAWLEPSKKKYMDWMILIFITAACLLQVSGIEPLYFHQPIIFSIGANMILIGSGLYFINMITHERYLASNPLRLPSFWQMTFIMFAFSLSYISSVALLYLYEVNPVLGKALQQIGDGMIIINLVVLTLSIASPLLPRIFENEPSYDSH